MIYFIRSETDMRLLLPAIMLIATPVAAQPAMTAPASAPASAPAMSPAPGYVANRPPLALMRLLPPPPEAGSTD